MIGLIKIRLSHSRTASDSNAADARYHNHCRLAFMGGNNIVYATRKACTTEILKIDQEYGKVRNLLEDITMKLYFLKPIKTLEDVACQDKR